MHTKHIILVVAMLGAINLLADVHSDAYFWLRSMGRDANGNGQYDSNELLDSAQGRSLSASRDSADPSQILWNTEDVFFPSRYVTRNVRTLYFAQTVKDEGTDSPTYCPGTISATMPAAADVGEHYSLYVRFKPAATQLPGTYKWLVFFGNSWEQKGMLLGFMPGNSGLIVAAPMRNNIPAYATTNGWNDLIVSVDGKKVTWLFQKAPNGVSGKTWMVSGTIDVPEGKTAQPAGTSLRLGGENPAPEWRSYSTSDNRITAFRGGVQDFAFWMRSLTLDEMKEAISAPRLDLMRVGVENDSTADFVDTATPTRVNADGDWNLPHDWSANQSLTVGFTLETIGQRRLTQALRVKTTTSSAACSIRAVLNEIDLGTVTVSPGKEGWWLVSPTALAADNTLVLTRTDAGSAAAHLDVIGLGGSIQLGENTNNAEDDFGGTDTPLRPYPLVSGHARAFPYTLSKATVPTASLLIDEPHAQLRDAYHYFGVRVASQNLPQAIRMTFNGKTYEAKSVPHSGWIDYSWKIDPSEIKAKGNEVVLSSSEDGAVWFDSVSWSFEKFRKGMILIFR